MGSWCAPGALGWLYRGADGVVLAFGTEDRAAFGECRSLYANMRTYLPDAPAVCCGVAGMRPELPRAVTAAEARALCAELGVEYREVEVGADDGRVEALFDPLLREMVRRRPLPPRANDNAPPE